MKFASALTVLSAAILVGCGGGDGGSTAGSPASSVTPTSVGGVVSKGLVKHANVLVCRIVGGTPEPDATCASGITGSDGSYHVVLGDGFAGPVMVKVVGAAGSMMTDETTGNDVPYGMTMRALAPAVSGTTIVHVTPFSEMAAAGASQSIPMDATKIRQAIGAVQAMMSGLAIDMTVMPMLDLKNDGMDAARLGDEANLAGHLARVAMAAKHSGLLKGPDGVPCNAPGTATSQQFACAVAAMAGVMTDYVTADQTRLAALLAAMNAQHPTNIWLAVRNTNGSVVMQHTDMTSFVSMQTTMHNGGMSMMAAATATNTMMGRMH